MATPKTDSHLVRILSETFAQRRKNRPDYSYRALARDVGVSHTTLQKVLSGDLNLKLATAKKVLARLKLEPAALREALTRIRIESEKDESLRQALISADADRHAQARSRSVVVRLSAEEFPDSNVLEAIRILSLFPLRSGTITPALVYKWLRIPSARALTTLGLLETKGLIYRDSSDRYHAHPKRWEFVSVRHSTPLKQCHLDALRIAERKIRELSPTERYSATEMLPISKNQLAELNEICDEFIDRLRALSDLSRENHDQIVLIALHAVPHLSR